MAVVTSALAIYMLVVTAYELVKGRDLYGPGEEDDER